MQVSVSTASSAIRMVGRGKRPDVGSRVRQTAAPAPGARAALRAATHDIHERLHHHPALARLAAGAIDRDEYRHTLARSYGFYAVVEPMLGLASGLTDCLVGDLAELGVSTVAIAALPRCALPKIGRGHAEMIGARYVLLGASLGGKVMARALSARSPGTAALPIRFLTGTNTDDWGRFSAGLDTELPDAAAQTRAAAAAVSMFAAYENWMSG